MEYHDQPMQFISSHYFKVKSKDDAKYRIILNMIVALTHLPSVLLPLISFLTILYIYPTICYNIKEYLKIDGNNRLSQIKQLSYAYYNDQMTQTKITKKWKAYQLGCAFLTSCAVTVVLIFLHFASASEFINYGNDILHDEEYFIGSIKYHHLPYIHAILSSFLIAVVAIVAIIFSAYKWNIVSLTATSFSVNIIYTVSYFFPTMLLAFIHDPLLTIFTCFMIIAGIGFAFTLLWGVGSVVLGNLFWGKDLTSSKTIADTIIMAPNSLKLHNDAPLAWLWGQDHLWTPVASCLHPRWFFHLPFYIFLSYPPRHPLSLSWAKINANFKNHLKSSKE